MSTNPSKDFQPKTPCFNVEFENEIGHKIRVATGTYYEPLVQDKGIFIKIVGPTSEHENYITRFEAQKIHEGLGKVLSEFVDTKQN